MAYAKREREQIGFLETQMHQIVNKCDREGRRGLTGAEQEQFFRLEADHERLQGVIRAAEGGAGYLGRHAISSGSGGDALDELGGLEQVRDTFRLSVGERRDRDRSDPYAKAFSAYLRGGHERLSEADRAAMAGQFRMNGGSGVMNTMSTTTGSQGGYVVPQGFSGMLEEAKKWFGGIEGVTGKFSTGTGNPWPWPTINDSTNQGRFLTQNTQVTETDLVFGQVTFNSYIGTSDLVLMPLALTQDSFFDMDALVARLLGIRLGRLQNHYCTVGSGTDQPTGIVTAAVASGLMNTFPTGETAAIAYDDLVNTMHSVDPAYRGPNSRWMFNDLTLKLLRKLVDSTGRPLWRSGLTSSFVDGTPVVGAGKPEILGVPYVINNDMAVPAANAYSVLFGDMSCFKVREVAGGTTVMVLRERYADYLQIGFIAFERYDSNLVDAGTHPICVGQNSAT